MFLRIKNVKNYVRDISIVIVGIVITFAGSGIITRIVKQKEVKIVMEVIKEEIEENLVALDYLIRRIEEDGVFFQYLVKNEGLPVRELSFDTLLQNKILIMDAYGMTLRNDALELLKSSSLIQYVKDKELLLKINESYDAMLLIQLNIEIYSEHKSRVILEVLENVPKDKMNRILDDRNVYEFYETVLSDSKVWYFIKTRNSFADRNDLSNSLEKLYEVIRMLNKEYGFKDKESDRREVEEEGRKEIIENEEINVIE